MKVKELIEMLAKMDPEAVVAYPDTYSRSEGWWDDCENETCTVCGAVEKDGMVVLNGEDD